MPPRPSSGDSALTSTTPTLSKENDRWGLSVSGKSGLGQAWTLGDLLTGVRARWWLVALMAILGTTALGLYSARLPVQYTATATIELLRTSPVVMPIREVVPTTVSSAEDVYTQLQWLASTTIAERVARRLSAEEQRRLLAPYENERDDPPRTVVQTLLEGRRVEPVRLSVLLAVNFQHREPELAARIANYFAEEFISSRTAARTSEAQRATEDLQGKVDQQRRLVGQIALSLQEFKEKNDVVSLDARRDIATARLQEISARVTQRSTQAASAEARRKLLRDTRAADLPMTDLSSVAQAPPIGELQREIANRKIAMAELTRRYRARHPRMIEATAGLAAAHAALERAVRSAEAHAESEVLAAQSALEQDRAALARQEKETFRLQRLAIEYDSISRELGSADQLYRSILSRVGETTLSGLIQSANARVMDRALAPDFLSARRHLMRIATGAVGGLVLGLGLAVLLSVLDDRLTNSAALETTMGLPVLAEIPRLRRKPRKGSAPPLVTPEKEARVFEAFRDLYCSLKTSRTSQDARVILVASPDARDGTSFVAVNLARMCALHDERTLLIDANLRQPVLHRCFNVGGERGLNQITSGAAVTENLVMAAVEPRLDLLPAGSPGATPAEILGSRDFAQLLATARTKYDRIIIDAPSLRAGEAASLAADADACLFLARYKRTRRKTARAIAGRLTHDGVPLLGSVLNALPPRQTARKFRSEHQEGWDREPAAVATT